MDLRSSRILSVCSGVGQLDNGVRVAIPDSRVVCCVEHEAYAAHILASRMEDEAVDAAPIWTNLRTFVGRPWRGLVDGIVGGYPCQPFSQAGKRLGTEDPRHLWPVIRQNISWIRPGWCFFENVRGHLSLGFEKVYRDLRRLGYRVKAGLFSAEEVGASHQRERLFILAVRTGGGLGELREPPREGGLAHGSNAHVGNPGGASAARLGGEHRPGAEGSPGVRPGTRKSGVPLADTGDGRLSVPGRGPEGRDGAGSAGTELADGHSAGRRGIRPTHDEAGEEPPRNDADGCDPALADAQDNHRRRGERGAEAGARPDGGGRRGSPGGSGEVADSESARLQGLGPEESARGSVPAALRRDGGASPYPIFAPGPSDFRIWGRVVADGSTNGLAPSTEPGVRMLANGVALVVDESRRDQLRAIGNGVVPLQAAFALSVLAREMGIVL